MKRNSGPESDPLAASTAETGHSMLPILPSKEISTPSCYRKACGLYGACSFFLERSRDKLFLESIHEGVLDASNVTSYSVNIQFC